MNTVIMTGNLTKDPAISYTNSGTAVCTFGLANNEGYGDNEKTTFIDVVVWGSKDKPGQAGAVADHLKKGSKVLVVGSIQVRSWEKEGVKKYKTEIVCQSWGGHRVEFLDSKPKGEGGARRSRDEEPEDIGDAGRVPVGDAKDVDPDLIPFD